MIFDQLDLNGNGFIEVDEFHLAIQAVSPVHCLEDLRRRWLASGYCSMLQALEAMDETGERAYQRIGVAALGELLSRVRVEDPAIFSLLQSGVERPIRIPSLWLNLEVPSRQCRHLCCLRSSGGGY